MLSRRPWIAAFIGHVLRRGHAVDPDWAFDTAGDLYLDWREVTPELAADSAFCPGAGASDSSASRQAPPTSTTLAMRRPP